MKRASLVRVVLLTALMGVALVGCERQVTGETYDGQINGGRSMHVTRESPPRGATGAGAPAELPVVTRTWSVRESDPAIRGLLASSGARIVLRDPPRPRPIVPPPAPAPAGLPPTAVPPTTAPPTAVPPAAVAPAAAAPAAVAPAVAMPIARPIRVVAPRPAGPAAAPAPAAPAPASPAPAPAAQP